MKVGGPVEPPNVVGGDSMSPLDVSTQRQGPKIVLLVLNYSSCFQCLAQTHNIKLTKP